MILFYASFRNYETLLKKRRRNKMSEEKKKLPECYGKRFEAYDKCEECPEIIACSIITLEINFPKSKVIYEP